MIRPPRTCWSLRVFASSFSDETYDSDYGEQNPQCLCNSVCGKNGGGDPAKNHQSPINSCSLHILCLLPTVPSMRIAMAAMVILLRISRGRCAGYAYVPRNREVFLFEMLRATTTRNPIGRTASIPIATQIRGRA